MDLPSFIIRPLQASDRELVLQTMLGWGAGSIVSRGRKIYAADLPGFCAVAVDGQPIGLATYEMVSDECEVVTLDGPAGDFTLPEHRPSTLLLISGGSGITPIMSICKSALSEGGGQVTLVYANRDDRSVIFRDALKELAAKYPLKEIQVTAEPVPGKPGLYKSEVQMIPHFKLKGIDVIPGP